MERDKHLLEKKYEEVNLLNVQLSEKVKQLQAVQETGKAILSVLNLGKLLHVIMSTLSNVCRINRAIIMIVNEKEGYLGTLKALYGETPEKQQAFAVKNTGFFGMSLMYAAKELGFDTHPMDGFDHDAVKEVVKELLE